MRNENKKGLKNVASGDRDFTSEMGTCLNKPYWAYAVIIFQENYGGTTMKGVKHCFV